MSLIKYFYRISWNTYLIRIRFTAVERTAEVFEILTVSISRLCHGYNKEVLNFGNTSYISTCCHPKTELRNTMKAINLPCRPQYMPSKCVKSIICNSDYVVSKSFTFLRHITNCRQISVESRTRAVWNSSFRNMYIVMKRKFLMSTAIYSMSQEVSALPTSPETWNEKQQLFSHSKISKHNKFHTLCIRKTFVGLDYYLQM